MRLALKIAWRFLSSSRGQTLLITVGIAIGIAVQVFIGSLITGLQKSLINQTIGRASHITVKPADRYDRIEDYRSIMALIDDSEDGVIQISPAVDAAGFIKADDSTFPVLARGFDLAAAEGIYQLKEALVEGALPGDGEVIIGRDLAEEASLAVGDDIQLMTPQGQLKDTTIAGIYDLKVAAINKSWVIADMPMIQGAFGYGDEATSIETQVEQVFDADIIAGNLSATLGTGYSVENWKAQNESLLSGLDGQSISSLMIQVFVLVSVVLGIASVLAISVLQKSRQLGILKAMGIKNRTASLIFLFQGLILGIFGAALGVLLGLGLAFSFTKFAVKADGSPVVALFIDPNFILLSGLIGVASATIAALIPASRSARLDPMEVIKNG